MKFLWQKLSFGQHLIVIVLVKMVILYGIWYVYIKPNKVTVSDADMVQIYSPNGQSPALNPSSKRIGVSP